MNAASCAAAVAVVDSPKEERILVSVDAQCVPVFRRSSSSLKLSIFSAPQIFSKHLEHLRLILL